MVFVLNNIINYIGEHMAAIKITKHNFERVLNSKEPVLLFLGILV